MTMYSTEILLEQLDKITSELSGTEMFNLGVLSTVNAIKSYLLAEDCKKIKEKIEYLEKGG